MAGVELLHLQRCKIIQMQESVVIVLLRLHSHRLLLGVAMTTLTELDNEPIKLFDVVAWAEMPVVVVNPNFLPQDQGRPSRFSSGYFECGRFSTMLGDYGLSPCLQ